MAQDIVTYSFVFIFFAACLTPAVVHRFKKKPGRRDGGEGT